MPAKLIDIVGRKFGTLTVLSRAEGRHEAHWLCQCDCGHQKVYVGGKLRRGDSRCKCQSGKDRTGASKSERKLYSVWRSIKERCTRVSCKSYANYGGRGISVCREWAMSFDSFVDWAKNNGWQHGLEIDRIDNDGNYEPSNCRFVTPKENCRNKSSNRIIEFQGESRLLVEWADHLNIPMKVLHNRLNAYGWSIERALTTPHRSVSEAAKARYSERALP